MESIVASFHNQKKGDFDTESGVIYSPGTKEYDSYVRHSESIRRMESAGEVSETEEMIDEVLGVIRGVELKQEYIDNEAQQLLLVERKSYAVKLVSSTMTYVTDYIDLVVAMGRLRETKDGMDIKDYQTEMKKLDEGRRRKHNALIDSINIVIRFVRNNFGVLSQDEEKFCKEKFGEDKFLYSERVQLKKNVFLPDRIKLDDRHQIADWAAQLAYSVSKIQKTLS
jgi:hypothetical protein